MAGLWLARQAAAHGVRRPPPQHHDAAARSIHARLLAGDALVLFPEGTSNDGNRILPFRSALFSVAEAATERPLTVQPVSIAYTSSTACRSAGGCGRCWPGTANGLGAHLWRFSRLGMVEVVVQFHDEARVAIFRSRKELTRHCSDAVAGGVDRALGGRLPPRLDEGRKYQLLQYLRRLGGAWLNRVHETAARRAKVSARAITHMERTRPDLTAGRHGIGEEALYQDLRLPDERL